MDAEGRTGVELGARTGPWSEASTWVGNGIRREVFYFRSGGVELYGSLFVAAPVSRSFGIVACNSWGVEADRCDPLQRSLALAMAKLGGAGLVFHYPGYADSHGDLAGVDIDDLSRAASDAVAEAARRCPEVRWILAGFMFGASVACLAQKHAAAETLLLVQPALRPGAYFRQLIENPKPLPAAAAGGDRMAAGDAPGMAYGYPIPQRIADRAAEADAAVGAALAGFQGDGVVIRHERPEEIDGVPERFQGITVSGAFRFGTQNHPKLAAAAAEWLDAHTLEAGR